jgi:flagellar motility protein MotE (MotC chaperone)
VIVALAGLSFSVSLFISRRPAPKPHAVATPQSQPAAEAAPAMISLAAVAIPASAKDAHLDNLAKELRAKLQACKTREAELDQQEKRVKLAQESLKKQADELESLRMKLVSPLAELKQARTDLEQTRVVISRQEKAQLKRTAVIYDKMDSANSGKIIEGMMSNKQENDAARILYFMSERSAAKLLAAITDQTIAIRLCDRMKKIQEEE